MRNMFFLLLVAVALTTGAQTTTPQKLSGSKFSVSCANLYCEIDSAFGARIISLKVDDAELLYTSNPDGMYGSTFWPSPQSVWGWPPLANLDNKGYKTSINGNKIVFAGKTDTKTNLRFYKTMFANSADTSITIDYCMKNEKASAQTWAPWEVSRVLGKGITLFAKGEGEVTGKMSSFTEETDGYVWYNQDEHSATSSDFKFFCDGKGWLAHVVDGNRVFIKKFEDIDPAKAAPEESEIEVYTANRNLYTELENQGAYASIASKDSVTWRVKWFARTLPSSVDVSVGSSSLVAFIEGVLKRSTDAVGKKDIEMAAVKVYPNPASEFLMIQTNLDSYSNAEIIIYTLQGKQIAKQAVTERLQQVEVGKIGKGSFLYDVMSQGQSIAKGVFSVK